MRQNLATLFDDFRRHGSQIAVVAYRGNRQFQTTWKDLAELSARFAAELTRRDVQAGDRVLLWGANSAEWVAAFFGCLLRGVVAVPLDAAGNIEFARRIGGEVGAKLAVGSFDQLRHLESGAPPSIEFTDFAVVLPPPDYAPAPGLTRDSTLQIVFTSGATAEPKGIVHTHGNVLASLDPLEEEIGKYLRYERLAHPLRILHTLPLSHVFGQFMGLWAPPLIGAEVHYEDRLDAARMVRTIRRHRISVLAAPPRVLDLLRAHFLAENPGLLERLSAARALPVWKRWWKLRDLHRRLGFKFWVLVSGGAAISPSLENFWRAAGFALIQGYGMTETTALVTINHPFKPVRGSIGKPLPGREIDLGPDGELLVRGGPVAERVWRHGRMESRGEGWLATGDIVTRNEEGQLVFAGRKADAIVTSAGVNVYPGDLEEALKRQPGVRDALVVSYDSSAGPAPAAAILWATPDQKEAEAGAVAAVETANRELAQSQRILYWALWPRHDFPRTTTGKPMRREVALWMMRTQGGQAKPEGDGGARGGLPDPLDALLQEIAPASPHLPIPDEVRLSEDLHLDSLAMVQLASEVEERFGTSIDEADWEGIRTVGDLRHRLQVAELPKIRWRGQAEPQIPATPQSGAPAVVSQAEAPVLLPSRGTEHHFPRWPWWPPMRALRACFLDGIVRPLVKLLLAPRVVPPRLKALDRPSLIIVNHVTFFDTALAICGLCGADRRKIAIMMSGELLSPWRRAKAERHRWIGWLTPLAYWLVTGLFNVFPLPRGSGLRKSFAHAGEALDRGYHVMVFPEGARSADGKLQPFEKGIGLLARESLTSVLPIYLDGLGALKLYQARWFRPGTLTVRVGDPIGMERGEDPAHFAQRLEAAMRQLARPPGTH